jgi:IclR family transcriptional regulator, acetate operon repressor
MRGYVRQPRAQGDYAMTTKLMSLGLAYLSGCCSPLSCGRGQ